MDPRLRRGGRFEREIEVTGSKQDRAKLILALLLALSHQIGTGSHSSKQYSSGASSNLTCLSAMDRVEVERVADMVADRTGERAKGRGKSVGDRVCARMCVTRERQISIVVFSTQLN